MYDENVAYIADHFAVKTTEALGGDALLDAFATHEVNGLKVNMRDEIVSIVSDDPGALDGRIEDLEGITVEVIANVRYDEYNEVRKLSPKKILQKYY